MSEKRRDPRITEDADVVVNIKSAPGNRDLENRTFTCHTTDISLRGMQLLIDTDIEVGTLLELAVDFKHNPEKFIHMGNVVWKNDYSFEEDESRKWYSIGIRFDSLSNPQYKSWVFAITELLGSTELS